MEIPYLKKPSREQYDKRKVFEKSIKLIRRLYGIELVLSDVLELDNFIEACFDDRDAIQGRGGSLSQFDPALESVCRIMTYLGLSSGLSCLEKGHHQPEQRFYWDNPEDVREYFKLIYDSRKLV